MQCNSESFAGEGKEIPLWPHIIHLYSESLKWLLLIKVIFASRGICGQILPLTISVLWIRLKTYILFKLNFPWLLLNYLPPKENIWLHKTAVNGKIAVKCCRSSVLLRLIANYTVMCYAKIRFFTSNFQPMPRHWIRNKSLLLVDQIYCTVSLPSMEKFRGFTDKKKIHQHSTVSRHVASKQVAFLLVHFN